MKTANLREKDLKELCEIMSKGNLLLKECAEMMGMQHRQFRGALFGNRLDTSKLSDAQLQKLNQAIPAIMDVRNKCENKVIEGFTRLIMQQAHLAARHHIDSYNARHEFAQEGLAAVLDAIYSYTDTNVKLSTFVWSCVRRRVLTAVNKLNPLCPLTNEALELVRKFEIEKAKLSTVRYHTDEEVVELMGLTPEERDIIFSATTKVVNQSVVSDRAGEENADVGSDYTGLRRGVDKDVKEVEVDRKEIRQALKDAPLDSFELEVLLSDMFPYHGWQEHVASKHTNERTGKRFTRQNIPHVLERAKKKVRDALMFPPKVHKENDYIDKLFDELSGKEL